MTNEQQYDLYTRAFTLILDHPKVFRSFPLNVPLLCETLGIELCPLSRIMKETGLSRGALFRIWGNCDGVILSFGGRPKIAYNDEQPVQRQRFTICEEVSHYILGHTEDPRFNLFSQDYDPFTYRQYEEAGRSCAGLLLCQPQYFYKNPKQLDPFTIATLFDVSWDCARTRRDTLIRFHDDITSHPLFPRLPQPHLSLAGTKIPRKVIIRQRSII